MKYSEYKKYGDGELMKKRCIISVILGIIIGIIMGGISGGAIIGNIMSKNIDKYRKLTDKNLALFLLYNNWLKIKLAGGSIREYVEKEGYKSVAIYGMSHVGERLLEELKGSDVEIKYAIDRRASWIYSDIELYSPDDNLPDVDVVVVTAVYFFDEVYNNLKDKVRCPIISLEDVLCNMVKL